jgi:hypothetical protein
MQTLSLHLGSVRTGYHEWHLSNAVLISPLLVASSGVHGTSLKGTKGYRLKKEV